MKLLLDTHVFLWWSENNPRLEREARQAIAGADLVLISAASAWEAVIKIALGKLRMAVPFEQAVRLSGFSELSVSLRHTEALAELLPHHRDPFDRMLVAQARSEQLKLVTHDRRFEPYPIDIVWA